MLPLSELKAFADDNYNEAQMVQFYPKWVQKRYEKRKNAVTTMFSKGFYFWIMKSRDCLGIG